MNAPLPVGAVQSAQALEADLPDIGAWTLPQLVDQAQALAAQGHPMAAAEVYRRWLATGPRSGRAAALFNYGSLLQQIGHAEAAAQAYRSCIECAPGMGHAYINLGLILERSGRIDEALDLWGRCAANRHISSGIGNDLLVAALNHIGRVQEQRRRYDLAEGALRESLQLNPDQSGVIQHWIHIRQKACAWPIFDPTLGIPMNRLLRCTSPLAMLALTEDPLLQLATAQSFVQRTYAVEQARLHEQHPPRGDGRIRIGLLSADFREHAVGFLLPQFLRAFDRSGVDLYAYDNTQDENTAQRQEILNCFDVVRRIQNCTDRQAAERMADDRLDLLIDLHGLSAGARPGILAQRPAPRQGTYLGFIGTTALPWVDFVLVDRHVMPPQALLHFSEQPVVMDTPFIPLSHRPVEPGQVHRGEAGLPAGAFVMASFGNVYKITPELFGVWMGLLRRIPDSVLWLLDDNPVTTANLRRAAFSAGIDTQRLVFAPRQDHETFRQRLTLADVYLDTYPYNGGSTTNDVIDAGVPFITRHGPTMVSRMGYSILKAVPQAGRAVSSFEAYADQVVEVWMDRRRQRPRLTHLGHSAGHAAWVARVMNSPAGRVPVDPVSAAPGIGREAAVVELVGLDPAGPREPLMASVLSTEAGGSWLGFMRDADLQSAGWRRDALQRRLQAMGPQPADLISLEPIGPAMAHARHPFEAILQAAPIGAPDIQTVLNGLLPDAPPHEQWWATPETHLMMPWVLAPRHLWLRWLELSLEIERRWGAAVEEWLRPCLWAVLVRREGCRVTWLPAPTPDASCADWWMAVALKQAAHQMAHPGPELAFGECSRKATTGEA